VSEEELERARTNFLAAEHFERESVSGLAHKLGSFQVFAGDHRVEDRYLEAVRTATPADLRRAAERHLSATQLTVAALLPETEASALDAERIEGAVGAGLARTARVFAAPRPAAAPAGIESFELAGGAALHVVRRPGVPVVAARAALRGGLLAEDETTSGLSSFLSAMWLRGTRNRSTAGFARAAENRGVEIDSFSGRSSQGLTFEAPSERVDDAIGLLCEALLEPAFDVGEIERERRDTLAAIERREDRLAQRAFLLFAETHYRRHPYRHPMLGSADCVSGFDRDQLTTQHGRIVKAPNLVVAVAGDVDPERVAAQLGARLADLPAEGFRPPCPAVEDAPREIRSAEQRKDRAQAHLVIGFRGLTVRDEDRFALEVISQLLAGQGGRLFLELRDRRGLAYSVSASNVEGSAPGYFSVYIATAPEKFDEARSGLFDELRGLLDTAPAEDELDRAVRYLVGSFAIELQRNAAHAAHVSLDALYGLGPDASRHYAERVRAVSREDVLRVARRIIDLDAYTLAAIRP